MKNLILFIALFVFTLSIQSQDKVYTLTEVDVAPKMKNYKNIDSLDSKRNFKRSIKRFIVINLDLSRYNGEKTRVFVEFVIKDNGKFEILRVKGRSDQAKAIVVKAMEKIKKMQPASINEESVSMSFIIPVTLNEVIIIDKTRNSKW
ncbi:MAG: hypothetical protein P8I51_09825 [Polaribacter sp.]|jgi:hypothetical protein|nr:hypothetical protein [Polaribacter sp.]MDG1955173.1 hypothetical protein [Polaribacter sp.]MDG2073894.1 hypothetical protein [Polaribacter sp.]